MLLLYGIVPFRHLVADRGPEMLSETGTANHSHQAPLLQASKQFVRLPERALLHSPDYFPSAMLSRPRRPRRSVSRTSTLKWLKAYNDERKGNGKKMRNRELLFFSKLRS
jgi:hypothetical protein